MFNEDLTAFFSDTEFSVPATLAGGAVVQVIFDKAHASLFDGEAEGVAPRATGRTADLGALAYNAAITVQGTAYVVVANQPDGTGITTLKLREA